MDGSQTTDVQCNVGSQVCTLSPEGAPAECDIYPVAEGLPECSELVGEPVDSYEDGTGAGTVAGIVTAAGSALIALGLVVRRWLNGTAARTVEAHKPKAESADHEEVRPPETVAKRSFERSTGEFVDALLTEPAESPVSRPSYFPKMLATDPDTGGRDYPEFVVRKPGARFGWVVEGGPDSADVMVDHIERGYDVEFIDFEGGEQPLIGSGEEVLDRDGFLMTEAEELDIVSTGREYNVQALDPALADFLVAQGLTEAEAGQVLRNVSVAAFAHPKIGKGEIKFVVESVVNTPELFENFKGSFYPTDMRGAMDDVVREIFPDRLPELTPVEEFDMGEWESEPVESRPEEPKAEAESEGRRAEFNEAEFKAAVRERILNGRGKFLTEGELSAAVDEVWSRREAYINKEPDKRGDFIERVVADVKRGMTTIEAGEVWEYSAGEALGVTRQAGYKGYAAAWNEVLRARDAAFASFLHDAPMRAEAEMKRISAEAVRFTKGVLASPALAGLAPEERVQVRKIVESIRRSPTAFFDMSEADRGAFVSAMGKMDTYKRAGGHDGIIRGAEASYASPSPRSRASRVGAGFVVGGKATAAGKSVAEAGSIAAREGRPTLEDATRKAVEAKARVFDSVKKAEKR